MPVLQGRLSLWDVFSFVMGPQSLEWHAWVVDGLVSYPNAKP